MSDFDGGLPFVAGSVFGKRVWYLREGRLVSPIMYTQWSTEEMVADCHIGGNASVTRLLTNEFSIEMPASAAIIPWGATYDYHHREGEHLEVHWYMDRDLESYRTIREYLPHKSDRAGWSISYDNDHYLSSYRGSRIRVDGWTRLEYPEPAKYFLDAVKRAEAYPTHLDVCVCGFYAYFARSRHEYASSGSVAGVVEGYGETVVGKKGFRCRKAKIVALAPYSSVIHGQRLTRSQRAIYVDRIKAAYPDVPVFKSESKMYRAFPLSKVSDFK